MVPEAEQGLPTDGMPQFLGLHCPCGSILQTGGRNRDHWFQVGFFTLLFCFPKISVEDFYMNMGSSVFRKECLPCLPPV